MALSYIVGTGVFAILGGVSLQFMYKTKNNTINSENNKIDAKNIKDSICYSFIDNNLNEFNVSSTKSPSLGDTFAQKCQSISNLLKEECNVNIRKTKNNRNKFVSYIKEYERIGIDDFVKKYSK